MLFAYFGPETVLPVTSAAAAVTGVALMFGRQTFRVLAMVVTGVARRLIPGKAVRAAPRPRRATLRPDAPSASPPQPAAAFDRERAGA